MCVEIVEVKLAKRKKVEVALSTIYSWVITPPLERVSYCLVVLLPTQGESLHQCTQTDPRAERVHKEPIKVINLSTP